MSSDMTVHEIYAVVKRGTKAVTDLTRADIIRHCDSYRRPSWLLVQLRNMAATEANPPKRRRTTKRKRTRKADTGRQTPRSSFHAEQVLSRGRATLELVERVNGGEVETEVEIDDNPLRLIDTQPDEQFPTFIVVHPDDDPDWLTANLPGNYERIGPEHDVQAPW